MNLDAILNFEYRNPKLYHWDQKHFSSTGYRKLAKDVSECIVNEYVVFIETSLTNVKSCVKIEFQKFKKILGY